MIQNKNSPTSFKAYFALLGLLTLLGALTALTLSLTDALSRAAAVHLFLALGVMPLILAAIAHFVPVLTRTSPETGDRNAALIGLVAGGLAVAGQQFWFPLVHAAALTGILAAGHLLANIRRRARRCLGPPHPGLDWYRAALWMLIAALLVLLASAVLPEQWLALRRLHLHLNLFGFVGLTAFSTLQVLFTTVVHQPDPATPARLKRQLPWTAGATACAAIGAAWWTPLAGVGLVVWLLVTGHLLIRLGRTLPSSGAWHNTATGLLVALVGLGLNLVFAVHHMVADGGGNRALWVFICAFLLPLISAALSHLVPLTLSSGVETAERARCQARLARHTLPRSLLYLGAGLLIAADYAGATLLAAVGVGWLLLQGAVAVTRWKRV